MNEKYSIQTAEYQYVLKAETIYVFIDIRYMLYNLSYITH